MRVQVTCRPELHDGEIVLHLDRRAGVLVIATCDGDATLTDIGTLVAVLSNRA